MRALSSILVVGAGQAAATAVSTLRDQGYAGRITMVGEEAHAPYERPPLSKAVLAAVETQEPRLAVFDDAFYATRDVELRQGTCVVALDPSSRRATLDDGAVLSYDRCLLATGGIARRLPHLPDEAPQVHYLRTLDDARKLRGALRTARSMIIIGGGFLGLEIASTAHGLGLSVTVVESAPRVLGRAVPEEFSSWLQAHARATGVALHLGQAIDRIQLTDNGVTMTLADGTLLTAELLVVSIGMNPATALARNAGLAIHSGNGGIQVDARCRSSDPTIFAAGDCASQEREGHGALRLESWQNANEQARLAAHAMLDQDTTPAAYPWFWTDQFGLNVQMLGLPQAGLRYVMRGNHDPEATDPKFIMLGLEGSIPRHALAVNAGGDLRALRPALERGLATNVAGFCDTSISMKATVKALLAQTAA